MRYVRRNITMNISIGGSSVAVPPDPAGTLAEEPPAGGGAPPPPPPTTTNAKNASPEHQPADSWEEAAVDADPLLTPENEEVAVKGVLIFRSWAMERAVSIYK